jgi:hypothetical protein
VAGNHVPRTVGFVPKGKMMMMGYTPLSFVCRDCGYLGSCLDEEERLELDSKSNQD